MSPLVTPLRANHLATPLVRKTTQWMLEPGATSVTCKKFAWLRFVPFSFDMIFPQWNLGHGPVRLAMPLSFTVALRWLPTCHTSMIACFG